MTKKKVIMFMARPAIFKELLPIAQELVESGEFQVDLLLDGTQLEMKEYQQMATKYNYNCILCDNKNYYENGQQITEKHYREQANLLQRLSGGHFLKMTNHIFDALSKKLSTSLLSRLGNAIKRTYNKFVTKKKLLSNTDELFHIKRYSLVIVSHSFGVNIASILACIANRLKIPSIGYPHCILLSKGTKAESIKDMKHNFLFLNILGLIKKDWIYVYNGKKTFPFDFITIMIWMSLGLLPKNIWSYFDGKLTAIAVHDDRMKEDLVSEFGIRDSQVYVTGDVSYDEVYKLVFTPSDIRRQTICNLGLDPEKKIIFFSAMNLSSHLYTNLEQEISLHIKLLKKLSELDNCQVILSLKPIQHLHKNDYINSYSKSNIKVFFSHEKPFQSLVPLSDIFISCWTSILPAPVLCKIPAFILDYAPWNFAIPPRDGNTYGSLPYVSSEEELIFNVNRALSDKPYRESILQNQLPIYNRLSRHFDGNSGQRFIRLAQKLIGD